MAKTKAMQAITRTVTLRGIADLMFDRYPGDNKTVLRPEEKLYLGPDKKTVVLPATNVMSFLSAENTTSAPKRLLDSRSYKKAAQACKSFVAISPSLIPITRNGRPIIFSGFENDVDAAANIYVHRSVARLEKGIPNPKVRPCIVAPWELSFQLSLFPNGEITEEQVKNLFINGGITIGLGTFRGVFGKFIVEQWN